MAFSPLSPAKLTAAFAIKMLHTFMLTSALLYSPWPVFFMVGAITFAGNYMLRWWEIHPFTESPDAITPPAQKPSRVQEAFMDTLGDGVLALLSYGMNGPLLGHALQVTSFGTIGDAGSLLREPVIRSALMTAEVTAVQTGWHWYITNRNPLAKGASAIHQP